jgi:predicted ABC-type ATPase
VSSGRVGSFNSILDRRPIVVAVAGPNGAGKSTFYHSHLRGSGLQFVNADVLAAGLGIHAYAAAKQAHELRQALVQQRESFIFETVFSDPAGDKVNFLKDAASRGYTVALFFIGIDGPDTSDMRVSMRVAKGGHDVPRDKLLQRFPRSLQNLKLAVSALDHVYILDNCSLLNPFRLVARFESRKAVVLKRPLPVWLRTVLSDDGEVRP